MKTRKLLIYTISICALFMLVVLACGGGATVTPPPVSTQPEATDTPTQESVVIETPGYSVTRDFDNAWATILQNSDQFTQLTTNDWYSLSVGSKITTDESGQAQICSISEDSCDENECHIYIYQVSSVGIDGFCCPKSGIDTTACNCQGSQTYLNCKATVWTISADVTESGTWYTIVYLWDSEITLVIVEEGTVSVTPVTLLEPNPPPMIITKGIAQEPPQLPQYEPSTRILDPNQTKTITVSAAESSPGFYFTAPDDKLKQLAEQGLLAGGPAPREWLNLEQLPDLRKRLLISEPQLELWLSRVNIQASKDGITLPGLDPLISSDAGLVVTTFGSLVDPTFADVLGYGVDWKMLIKEMGKDMPAVLEVADSYQGRINLNKDARSFEYNPETASQLVRKMEFNTQRLMLIVPSETLLPAANIILDSLKKIGLDFQVEIIPDVDTSNEIQSLQVQGYSIITLALR